MSAPVTPSAGKPAVASPLDEVVFDSTLAQLTHASRADDAVSGVIRFAVIAASILGLTALAVAMHRLWLGDLVDTQLGLAGNGLYTEALVFLCLGVAAHAGFRRQSTESLVAAAGLYLLLGFVFAQYHVAYLAGDATIVLRPSWTAIVLLVFVLLVPGPLIYHFGLLAYVALVSPVSLAIWALLGKTAAVAHPHTPAILSQRLVVSLLPTWICVIVGAAVALHRDRERRRWRLLAEHLHAARSKLKELGSYSLERRLGIGGMGEVWQATHRVLARPAAIKLVSSQFLLEQAGNPANVERFLARFLQEAKVTSLLTSSHTVQVYDYGRTDDGQLYYVMELLQGADLARVVKTMGPLPPERVVHWMLQLCDSLAEAHSLGLVHRDLKPANIFLAHQGAHQEVVKLLDFGLALARRRHGPGPSSLADAGSITGSPHFMAPEQTRGDEDLDGRADLYALGCVAWYLLTGQHVFETTEPHATMQAQVEEEPRRLQSVSKVPLPPRLVALIHWLLAKNPDERPQSADELAAELISLGLPRPEGPVLTPELVSATAEHDYAAERTLVLVNSKSPAK
ncbi:MAG TPA: serine/threonine-protein kinase [Candidatus Limnocylindria bacterium]|nr:serine/threonine-protein kinase [Candidatus Limnocylindria bacterium]